MEFDSHLMLSVMLLGADVSMAAVGHRIKVHIYIYYVKRKHS